MDGRGCRSSARPLPRGFLYGAKGNTPETEGGDRRPASGLWPLACDSDREGPCSGRPLSRKPSAGGRRLGQLPLSLRRHSAYDGELAARLAASCAADAQSFVSRWRVVAGPGTGFQGTTCCKPSRCPGSPPFLNLAAAFAGSRPGDTLRRLVS